MGGTGTTDDAEQTDGERDDRPPLGVAGTRLFREFPDAVVVLEDERIVRANRAVETEFGVSPSVVEGVSLEQLVTAGVISEAAVERYRRATGDGHDRYEAEIDATALAAIGDSTPENPTPSGLDSIRAEARVTQVDENRRVASLRDVTERRRTERALEALHETTQAFTVATDPDEIAQIACRAARTVIGMDANAVYLYDRERDLLEPAAATDAAGTVVGDLPTFDGNGSIAWDVFETGEARACPDLREEPDRYREATPLRSEIVLPLDGFGVVLIGATEANAFADWQVSVARVLAANTTRALDRAARETELRARREELERQNDRLDAFASVVSHDLRNPLNVAAGNLELARMEDDTDRLDDVSDALDHAEEIVDDVLTMAREGQTVESVERVALADLVGECWAAVATGDAAFVADEPPVVRGDRRRLRRVLENLFANAVEHATSGSDEPLTVRVGGLADGFYVEDDGVGIPPEDRDRLFDPGYSTGERGTGLGLTIVREMVEAHGWEIRVTEGAAGGARFEITGVDTV